MQPDHEKLDVRTNRALRTITTVAMIFGALIAISSICRGDADIAPTSIEKKFLVTDHIFSNRYIENLVFWALRTITIIAMIFGAFIAISSICRGDADIAPTSIEKKLLVTDHIFSNRYIENLVFRPLFTDVPEYGSVRASLRASVHWSRVGEQLRATNTKRLHHFLRDGYACAESLLGIKFMLMFVDPLRTERKTIVEVLRAGQKYGERTLQLWGQDRTLCNLSWQIAAVVGELTDGFRDIAAELERGNSRYLSGFDMKSIGLLVHYHPIATLFEPAHFKDSELNQTTTKPTTPAPVVDEMDL